MSSFSSYSDSQLKAFALAPIIPSLLSFWGSSSIVFIILSDSKEKLAKVYNRILFFMSSFDILSSLAYSLTTIPSPHDTEYIYGAMGNRATCTAQGIVIQMGFAVNYFFSILMLYYLLSIRFGMSDQVYKKKVEFYVNSFALVWPIITVAVGAFLKVFNNVGNICWIGPYPRECDKDSSEVECTSGVHYYTYQITFIGIPVCFQFVFIPMCMGAVLRTVYKQHREMEEKWGGNIRNSLASTDDVQQERPRRYGKREKQLKEVRVQATLYVCAFYLSFIWPFILRAFKITHPVLIMTAQIFYPLQGFWNFFIFIRLRISNLRKANPKQCFIVSLWIAAYSKEKYEMCLREKRRKSFVTNRRTSSTSLPRKIDKIDFDEIERDGTKN